MANNFGKQRVVERSQFVMGKPVSSETEETTTPSTMPDLSWVILALACVMIFVAMINSGRPEKTTVPNTVSVTGLSVVECIPDIAIVQFGVESKNIASAKAQEDCNIQSNQVLESLRGLGIADEDIQTSGVRLSQQQRWDRGTYSNDGYLASIQYTVKLRDLAKAGEVLNVITQSGAVNLMGPTYDTSNKEELYAKALAAAVADAKAKATVMLTDSKQKIVSIQSLNENYSAHMPRPVSKSYEAAGAVAMDSAVATEVMAGTMEISATVYVTYNIDG